jgi:hypothetical protein
MPTLLTTPKMSRALAARIEASVQGRRGTKATRRFATPRLMSVVRLGVVLAIASLVAFVVLARRGEQRALEKDRAALLAAVQKESASLTEADKGAIARIEAWLPRLGGAYEGDLAAPELRGAGGSAAMAALLARPIVYVRGPLEELATVEGARRAAGASLKDSLAVCLADPPAARTEKALLPKVRAAYGTVATVEQRTPNMRRLHDAEAGMPVLSPAWTARVLAAKEPKELATLRTELERAPIARAKQAVRAEVLLVAVDEPGAPGGLTELDGERAHDVRVAFVDLAANKVLLRLRRRVDPSPWSQSARTDFASGLDACALAYDVRARGEETPR